MPTPDDPLPATYDQIDAVALQLAETDAPTVTLRKGVVVGLLMRLYLARDAFAAIEGACRDMLGDERYLRRRIRAVGVAFWAGEAIPDPWVRVTGDGPWPEIGEQSIVAFAAEEPYWLTLNRGAIDGSRADWWFGEDLMPYRPLSDAVAWRREAGPGWLAREGQQ